MPLQANIHAVHRGNIVWFCRVGRKSAHAFDEPSAWANKNILPTLR